MARCELCKKFDDCSWRTDPDVYCSGFDQQPMTNADRIRAMTDEELAKEIIKCRDADLFRLYVMGTGICTEEDWLDWLRQEAADD